MIATALKILGVGTAVGFGTVVVAKSARRPVRRSELGPAITPVSCVQGVWAPMQPLDHQVGAQLPLSALLTLEQFPGFQITVDAQRIALEALEEYVDAVQEEEVEGGIMLQFPGVEESSIPEEGMDVGVDRALDRIENYQRFGAAAAAAALLPDCTWPEPFSTEIPDDEEQAAVWRSLEQLAVVALAARDDQRLRVDVDPVMTVLDDRLEACVPPDLVLPLRSPVALAPELGGDPDDASWQISQSGQVEAFAHLQTKLADPDATAPVSATAAALAPRCPWGDKRRYGLRMTTLWYDLRRIERIADEPQQEQAA